MKATLPLRSFIAPLLNTPQKAVYSMNSPQPHESTHSEIARITPLIEPGKTLSPGMAA
jgi:hypothetical protein